MADTSKHKETFCSTTAKLQFICRGCTSKSRGLKPELMVQMLRQQAKLTKGIGAIGAYHNTKITHKKCTLLCMHSQVLPSSSACCMQ